MDLESDLESDTVLPVLGLSYLQGPLSLGLHGAPSDLGHLRHRAPAHPASNVAATLHFGRGTSQRLCDVTGTSLEKSPKFRKLPKLRKSRKIVKTSKITKNHQNFDNRKPTRHRMLLECYLLVSNVGKVTIIPLCSMQRSCNVPATFNVTAPTSLQRSSNVECRVGGAPQFWGTSDKSKIPIFINSTNIFWSASICAPSLFYSRYDKVDDFQIYYIIRSTVVFNFPCFFEEEN